MSVDAALQRIWYRGSPLQWLLLPLALLFAAVSRLRRAAYVLGWMPSERVARPVIVIGNITVGGTGKTPLIIWLANRLQEQGLKAAVITRGYGGSGTRWPRRIDAGSNAREVGDEAVVIARSTVAIVVADPDRVAAARFAVELGAQVILTDDGLQHYRLQRDAEIAVVDASRLFGNGLPLPAGPLREPRSRLRHVSLVALNRREPALQSHWPGGIEFEVTLQDARNQVTGERRPISFWAGQPVHVVTAIGNPQAFVRALNARGLRTTVRLQRDHAVLTPGDVTFGDALPVLMTEKDAVKCHAFADSRHWVVGAEVVMTPDAAQRLLDCVQGAIERHAARPTV